MTSFTLDTQLANDSLLIGQLNLCQVRLSKDANYPWLILIPQRPNIVEVFDLTPSEQQQLWQEVTQTAEKLQQTFHADKINIATLGNVVKQLHIHIVARFQSDLAWPTPIWGKLPAKDYTEQQLQHLVTKLHLILKA